MVARTKYCRVAFPGQNLGKNWAQRDSVTEQIKGNSPQWRPTGMSTALPVTQGGIA